MIVAYLSIVVLLIEHIKIIEHFLWLISSFEKRRRLHATRVILLGKYYKSCSPTSSANSFVSRTILSRILLLAKVYYPNDYIDGYYSTSINQTCIDLKFQNVCIF